MDIISIAVTIESTVATSDSNFDYSFRSINAVFNCNLLFSTNSESYLAFNKD